MNNPKIAEYQNDPQRDWGQHPPRMPSIDQSTYIPNLTSDFTIPTNPDFLREPEEFEPWLAQVKLILQEYGLDALIDIKTPRPELNSPKAETWKYFSLLVRDWLVKNMSWKIYTAVLNKGFRIDLADEFILNARLAFQTMTQITILTNKVLFLERGCYRTTTMFVRALLANFVAAWETGVEIKPQLVLGKLFMELRCDLPHFVQKVTENIDSRGDVWDSISYDEVVAACESAMDALEELDSVRA